MYDYQKTQSPAVSVIIPVYNTEEYLPECLDSILGQTFGDFEIICVDDGSTDRSLKVLQDYASANSCILVMTQQNQFAGTARNKGIEAARGDYLFFMDSDDFMKPDLLEKTVAKARETDADIVVFGADEYNTLTGESVNNPNWLDYSRIEHLDVFSYKDIPDRIFHFSNPAPWNKLYSRDFVMRENLRYQSLPYTNDVYFTKLAFAVAKRITYVRDSLLCYRIGMSTNSQSRKFRDPFRYMEALTALYDALAERGLLDELDQGFTNYAVACLNYELRPYADRCDRIAAYKRILNDPLTVTVLSHDEDYYFLSKAYTYVSGLRHALAFHDRIGRTEWPDADPVCESAHVTPDPLLSVIVPFYNDEKYITECLSSITGQDYDSYELIAVNDGSTDNSAELVCAFAREHDNVRVLSEVNAGQSVARNNGIKAARGRYIVFLDGDDCLADGALRTIADGIQGQDLFFYNVLPFADVSGLSDEETAYINTRLEDFRNYYERKGRYDRASYAGPAFFDLLVHNDDYIPSPCFHAVRRDFLTDNDLWFTPGIVHEDQLYTFESLMLAANVSYTADKLYVRRVRPGSVMTVTVSCRNVYGYYVSYIRMRDFYYSRRSSHDWDAYQSSIIRNIRTMLNAARRDFRLLSDSEKLFRLGFDDQDKDEFEYLVADYAREADRAERQKARAEKFKSQRDKARGQRDKKDRQIARIEAQSKKTISRIRKSGSYRIGRAVTWLPRKLRGL